MKRFKHLVIGGIQNKVFNLILFTVSGPYEKRLPRHTLPGLRPVYSKSGHA